MEEQMKRMSDATEDPKQIPEFSTYEEEAEFWDDHDTEEFADQWEEVEVKVASPLKLTYSIALEPEILERVRRLAKQQGIGAATLAQIWIQEKLREAEAATMPTLE